MERPRSLKRDIPHHSGPQDKYQVWLGRSTNEGKAYLRTFLGVSVGKAKQSKINSLGLASLNNSDGLWVLVA